MTLDEAIRIRHSVRQYIDKEIDSDKISQICNLVDECNKLGNLHIQVVTNEPTAFATGLAKYGKFSGVCNYIAFVSKKSPENDEKIGFYGEKIGIFIQSLGLNFCWVGLTYKNIKTAYSLDKNEKLVITMPFGYGTNQGRERKLKPIENFIKTAPNPLPEWFKRGMEYALLAPTALNQQKFRFSLLDNNRVKAETVFALNGYTKIDLGIVKYHFQQGAGIENFRWENN